jgi:hypothetical protein
MVSHIFDRLMNTASRCDSRRVLQLPSCVSYMLRFLLGNNVCEGQNEQRKYQIFIKRLHMRFRSFGLQEYRQTDQGHAAARKSTYTLDLHPCGITLCRGVGKKKRKFQGCSETLHLDPVCDDTFPWCHRNRSLHGSDLK